MSLLRQTALGVDAQEGRIMLALLELRGRNAVVKRLVETTPPQSASDNRNRVLAAVIARAIRDESLKADTLGLGFPIQNTLIRRLHVPLTGRRKVAPALTFAMEPLVPFPAEDFVADYVPIVEGAGGTDLLAFAARHEDVTPLTHALELAGCAPDFLTPDLLPLLDAVPLSAGDADAREAIMFARGDRSFVALREGGRPVEIRALPGPVGSVQHLRQAQRSLLALAGGGAPLSRVVLVDEASEFTTLCEDVGAPVQHVTLSLPATVPDAIAAAVGDVHAWDVAICVAAQGLGQTRHALNLRQGELRPDTLGDWLAPAKRVGVLALAALVVYGGALALQRVALRTQRDDLRRQVQTRFTGVLKEATTVKAARTKLTELHAAHEDLVPFIQPGPGVLDVLAACDAAVRGIPKIHVESLTVKGDVLRLTGDVADFRAVNQLQASLAGSPMFLNVTTNKAGEGRRKGSTSFRLSARVNPEAATVSVAVPVPAAVAPAPVPAPVAAPPAAPPTDLFDDADVPAAVTPAPERMPIAAPVSAAPPPLMRPPVEGAPPVRPGDGSAA